MASPASLFETDGPDIEYQDARGNPVTRSCVDELWTRYQLLADRGFPARLRRRFLETFSEMFTACHLMDCGWTIEPHTGAGPDVRAKRDGSSLLVEVTMPKPGTGKGAVPPMVFTPRQYGERVIPTAIGHAPIPEMDSRFVKSLEAKASQRRAHERAGKVDSRSAAVLLVNMATAGYGYVPHDLARNVLLGVSVDGETSDGLTYGTGHFQRDEYRWLSAVLVARVTAWSAARQVHELVLLHNPRAAVPCPLGSWGSIREITG